jgi:hypothetical protein
MDEIINQETPVIETPPIQEQQTTKKKPSIWMWTTIIFFIIIIILFYTILKKQKIINNVIPTEIPTLTTTDTIPITETIPTIIPEKQNAMSNWEIYNNDKYGITFKYPKNWGKINIGERDLNSFSSAYPDYTLDLEDRTSNEIKKIIEIKFSNINNIETEQKMTQTPLSFKIFPYSLNNYLIFNCYEGVCNYVDILKEKENIIQKTNITTKNYKGYVHDGYFFPGANFSRIYEFISENNYIEVQGGFYSSIIDNSLLKEILTEISKTNTYNNKVVFLEDILSSSKQTTDIIETKKLLLDINNFINSIIISPIN